MGSGIPSVGQKIILYWRQVQISPHISLISQREFVPPHLLPHPLLPGHIHYTFKHLNCCYMLAVLINILIAAADPLMFCAAEDPIMLQTTYHLFLSMVTIK